MITYLLTSSSAKHIYNLQPQKYTQQTHHYTLCSTRAYSKRVTYEVTLGVLGMELAGGSRGRLDRGLICNFR
jgi:hypothetical protein